MGRVVWNGQAVYNQAWSYYYPAFGYDLMGDLTSYSNAAGVTLNQSFDTAGRMTGIGSSWVDSQHPATLAVTDATYGYFPTGQLGVMTLGNGLTETSAYGMRMDHCRININSGHSFLGTCGDGVTGNVLNLGYVGYASGSNNGNIARVDMNIGNGGGMISSSRSFYYDSLNRLQSVSSPYDPSGCTGLSWNYDAWGNRTDQTTTGGSCGNFHATFAQGNNRMDSYSYDAAGNLLYDGTHYYYYDSENRLIQVDGTFSNWPSNCRQLQASSL